MKKKKKKGLQTFGFETWWCQYEGQENILLNLLIFLLVKILILNFSLEATWLQSML